jgi:TolB protein
MKKNSLLIITLLLIPIMSYGELFLEITKGSEDPYKVAMIPFEGNTRVSKQLNSIVRNDLIRTGEFSILDEELLLPVKIINDELVYSDWKLLGMDYLVTGNITKAK